jgi:hypothetical protein
MNYTEIKIRVEELRNELSELGLEPIADLMQEVNFELDLAKIENLIK